MKKKQDVDYGAWAVKQNSKALSFQETNDIVSDIQSIMENTKKVAHQSVNFLPVERNRLIGKRISNEELKDSRKENYGLEIMKKISSRLTSKYGKGFSARNVYQSYNSIKPILIFCRQRLHNLCFPGLIT